MCDFDIIIRGGIVHDGEGGPPCVTDVAIRGDVIAAIGEISGCAREVIDAAGKLVTPGFIDVHTHYDGQATWENRLAPSSNHGVTTVVMGNCGVGFAPCRPGERDLLVEVMEGVEDVPEAVMTEGLAWDWESFPDYLDALDRRTFDVDIAAQLPHSALRVFVMGHRAACSGPPTAIELARMRDLTADAIRAGAIGVSTSRNLLHRTKAGGLAPSLFSDEDELLALADGLRDAGAGVFQIIPRTMGDAAEEFALMRRVVARSGRPLSYSLLQMPAGKPDEWRVSLAHLEAAAGEGVPIRAQIAPRPIGMLYGLDLSFHPFSLHPSFQPLLELPLSEKVARMRDPALRARLLSEAPQAANPVSVKTVQAFRFAFPMSDPPVYDPDPSGRIDSAAQRLGLTPAEYVYDLLLERDGRMILYQPTANYRDGNLDAVRTMIEHPLTVVGLADGGAHYGMICDASFPTYLLQHWSRDAPEEKRIALAQAIRELTSRAADLVGLADRGRLKPGCKADINVIDLAALKLHAPIVAHDLPAGGRRLRQRADGYAATIVSGQVTYRHGEPSGALPGRLVRGPQDMPPISSTH